MKIALLGYGKMGKAIENIALERGHTIVQKVTRKTTNITLENADVAIDFSTPETAFKNISYCIKNKIPVISGTTGWLSRYDEIVALCKKQQGAFIYASNFSLGVNLFFSLNKKLAELMQDYDMYDKSITEIHHTEKIDAPSGTAITLAAPILEKFNIKNWVLGVTNNEHELPIIAERIANVPGTHKVKYTSTLDEIEIIHTAKNRTGFAFGAVIAAEWILGKKGIYTMQDVLEIKK